MRNQNRVPNNSNSVENLEEIITSMNDKKGQLIFIKTILEGYFLSKKSPRYLCDEIEWLSERWGCITQRELLEKIKKELENEN